MKAQQPQSPKVCPHFKRMISANNTLDKYSFIKPQLKGWLCLNDGCMRKVGEFQSIRQQIQKYEPYHKIFMEMTKLEIYCFQCNIEITDQMDKSAYMLRKLAVEIDKQQQKMLFGANIEYPPGFQKQKAGLSGTIGNQLNSYINAVIQLLAHTLPFYQISQQSNPLTIRDQCLKKTFNCINKIRSGVYRIVETKQVQQSLLLKNPQFHKYSFKTPSNFIFQILRSFSGQFQYNGAACKKRQIIEPLSVQTLNSTVVTKAKYSPMKELFAGEFIWQVKCKQCAHERSVRIQFQCLRLENEGRFVDKISTKLQQLIQSAFNFQKLFNSMYAGVICDRPQCKSKKSNYKLIPQKSHIKIPNLLLFQFVCEQGMSVNYPDIIDLSKYAGVQKNQQYEFHYVGSIAKNNKKYYTHVRQYRENGFREYVFDDVMIKQDATRPNKIVSAIYKMQPLVKNRNISKNIDSAVIVGVDAYVPLPDFWNIYLAQLRNIQPLINPFICRHGFLAPQINSKCKIVKKIPPSIYQYLVEQFGGTAIRIQKQSQFCTRCIQKLNLMKQLKQSEKEMAKFADQLSSKKSKACVDIQWFEKWRKYLYESPDCYYQNEGSRRPGSINNKKGLKQNNQIDETKYKKVSPQVWYFFKKFYGGGPLIAKNLTPPSLALTQAVDLRYDRIKKIIELLQPL